MSMKNPIKILQEEHLLLLQAIETGKQIQKIEDDNLYYTIIHDFIVFIRNYSEIYHHPKEENVLYPLLKNRSEKMNADFMHEICDNHEDFKSLIAEIENLYVICDYKNLRKAMLNYFKVFEEHIKRENAIILSVAEKLLTEAEKENITNLFNKIDEKNGDKENLKKEFYKIRLQLV